MIRHYAATILVALMAVLALSACAAEGGGDLTPAASARTISIEAAEFAFTPSTFTAQVGEEITFEITNNGTVEHNFVVLDPTDQELTRTSIPVGAMASVEVMTVEAGAYTIVCDIPGHREAGMEASLTVSSSVSSSGSSEDVSPDSH